MPQYVTPEPLACGCRVQLRVDVKPPTVEIEYCPHHHVDPELVQAGLEEATREATREIERQHLAPEEEAEAEGDAPPEQLDLGVEGFRADDESPPHLRDID